MGSPIAGRSPWRNRDLGLVLVGETVNNVGDWMLAVALPVFVYVETGSGLATGAVFIIELVIGVGLDGRSVAASSIAATCGPQHGHKRTVTRLGKPCNRHRRSVAPVTLGIGGQMGSATRGGGL